MEKFVSPKISKLELLNLEGLPASDYHFDTLINEDCLLKDEQTGRVILSYKKNIINSDKIELAKTIFSDIDNLMKPSLSRNSAAGIFDIEKVRDYKNNYIGYKPHPTNPFKGFPINSVGQTLKSAISNPVLSFMAGYNFDRYRMLAKPAGFSKDYPEKWAQSKPFFKAIDRSFSELMPTKHQEMIEWAKFHDIYNKFTIFDTCLTTVAINVNYESRYHFDRGDLDFGYSTLTKINTSPNMDGGYIVFPKYKVAVDVYEGSLLLCQSHIDLHGNTSIKKNGNGKKISFVTYTKWKLKKAKNKEVY